MFDTQNSTERFEMFNILKVLIILLSLTFLIYYRDDTVPVTVRINDAKFLPLGPFNATEYQLEDVYNQLIDIKNFTFLKNPQKCNTSNLLLVIIVASKPNHFDKRMAIRTTWGRVVDSTKIVFLMGESNNASIVNKIAKEQATFEDIVQGSFLDTYRNLTYKHMMGLKWVSHHCRGARYILKTDDDVSVNSHELRHFLVRELSPWGTENLITCQVFNKPKVQRDSWSKWKVTEQEYSGVYYPNYCAGFAILYSADVVPRLLSTAQNIPYFWIDDVHITGVVAQKLGIERTPLSGLIMPHKKLHLLNTTRAKNIGEFLIGPPDLQIDTIRDIWKAIPK